MTPCWYVKDFADGWIKFHDVDMAIAEAQHTGAIMRYSADGSYPSTPAAPANADCSDCLRLIQERDDAEAMCDKLSDKISELTGEDFGEHSSGNCPWSNALEAALQNQAAQPKAHGDAVDIVGLKNILRGMRARNEEGALYLTNWIADHETALKTENAQPVDPIGYGECGECGCRGKAFEPCRICSPQPVSGTAKKVGE